MRTGEELMPPTKQLVLEWVFSSAKEDFKLWKMDGVIATLLSLTCFMQMCMHVRHTILLYI